MKIPKYIDRLLKRRTKLAEQLNSVSTELDEWLAEQLNSVSTELDEWLENNEIPTDNDYTRTGCMIYCEPHTAERSVRDDILARSDTK